MIIAFGMVFPAGMVLGVSQVFSQCSEHISNLSSPFVADYSFSMACPLSNPRCCHRDRRILPWTHPQRPPIQAQYPRLLRDLPHAYAACPDHIWRLLKTTPRKRHTLKDTEIYCKRAWRHWKADARRELGANAVWRHHRHGLLPRRSFGTVLGPFYHGFGIYWLRRYHDDAPAGGPDLAAAYRPDSRILRFDPYNCVGDCQYFHRASMG